MVFNGKNWPLSIRKKLGTGSEYKKLHSDYALQGSRGGNVWFQLGKEIAFCEENQSNLKVGRIVGHCKAWLAIDVWIPLSAQSKSTRHQNGMAAWKKPISPQRLTIKVTQAFPISTTRIQSVPEEIYSVDDSSDWMEAWGKHIRVGHNEGEDVQRQAVKHSHAAVSYTHLTLPTKLL
jgi:hypothetical protein